MLTAYLDAAMRRSRYERLADGEVWLHIPGLPGVYASGEHEAAATAALRSVLEGWVILGLRLGHTLPILDGIDLTPPLPARCAQVRDLARTCAPYQGSGAVG